VVNAGIVKNVAMGLESQSTVKAFCAALGMQNDFLIAPFASLIKQGLNNHLSQMPAAQGFELSFTTKLPSLQHIAFMFSFCPHCFAVVLLL
jgi:hypothetical protein